MNYMELALEEAKKGYGYVAPNPMVGAVIVKDNEVIGKGYHQKFGEAHAEVNAVRNATKSCENATLFVTLEPCSTYGKTPPCTELIIKNKFKKVVIGTLDPNPKHSARAVDILKNANIEVIVGCEEVACKKINEAFFKYISKNIPLVTLKMAMTLDGKIACYNGVSKWITSDIARQRVQYLRRGSEAILIGSQTARVDRPTFYARNDDGTLFERKLKRFVASKNMKQEELEKLFPDGELPQIVELSTQKHWDEFLIFLGQNQISSLLIEGGAELAASALDNKIIDYVEFHIATKILGGRESKTVIGGKSPENLSNAIDLREKEIFSLGNDLAIRGKIY